MSTYLISTAVVTTFIDSSFNADDGDESVNDSICDLAFWCHELLYSLCLGFPWLSLSPS